MNNSTFNEASSSSNYLRISPLKLRRVVDQIRNSFYDDSIAILNFLPNRSSPIIKKCINSAMFNLRLNSNVNSSLVYIKSAVVNSGPVIKRFRPRAQGRSYSIKKRTSHLIILF